MSKDGLHHRRQKMSNLDTDQQWSVPCDVLLVGKSNAMKVLPLEVPNTQITVLQEQPLLKLHY